MSIRFIASASVVGLVLAAASFGMVAGSAPAAADWPIHGPIHQAPAPLR